MLNLSIMSVRITCIRKDSGNHENPYVAITSLGWINESTNATNQSTRLQIYDYLIDNGIAYVTDSNGNKAYLITAVSTKGTKYVKTLPDNVTSDNLLKLPECK